jgi:hypothetical protein
LADAFAHGFDERTATPGTFVEVALVDQGKLDVVKPILRLLPEPPHPRFVGLGRGAGGRIRIMFREFEHLAVVGRQPFARGRVLREVELR